MWMGIMMIMKMANKIDRESYKDDDGSSGRVELDRRHLKLCTAGT